MAGIAKIQIPDEEKATLHELRTTSDEAFQALLQRLGQAAPLLDLGEFAARANDSVEDEEERKKFIQITSLAVHSSRAVSIGGLKIDDIVGALLDLAKEGIQSGVAESEWESFRRRLDSLLTLSNVQLTASSGPLLTAHAQTYLSAQFLTDIRPIFLSSSSPEPDSCPASVLVHQMHIRLRQNKLSADMFIALDDDDLLQLKDAVEEAIRKSAILRANERISGRVVISK